MNKNNWSNQTFHQTRCYNLSKPVLLALLLLMVSQANAFDGHRKGFVLGYGVAYSAVANISSDNTAIDRNRNAFGLQAVIGYGLNDQYVLALSGISAWYETESGLFDSPEQNLTGLILYRYFRPDSHSIFLAGGLGVMRFDSPLYQEDDTGFGVMGGVGYQVYKHLQLGLYVVGGSTDGTAGKTNHLLISMTAIGIWF